MIHNISKQTIISANTLYARSFYNRARGMICRHFDGFDAMVFEHISCIHTMCMTINIDVIFVNEDNKVVGLHKKLARWLPFVRVKGAVTVIELPTGAIEKSQTEIGDTLTLKTETTVDPHATIFKNKVLNNTETIIPFSEKNR